MDKIGRSIHRFDTIGSTQDLARSLVLSGANDGEVIISSIQSRGKGRRGDAWVSPKGGLWFSIILFPYNLSCDKIFLFSLAIGFGIAKAIEKETGLFVLTKWPNDLYVKEKKIGGILIESDISLNRVNWLIVGIGINVNIDKNLLPENATSIREELKRDSRFVVRDMDISLDALFFSILNGINDIYLNIDGILDLLPMIKERCITIGKEVQFENISGRAIDIDLQGRLIIKTKEGKTVHFS
ncbi:MAG: biotin--[acetyl-CoA-carboxylase] ligase [bacterium]